jgi:hypothetical protein
MNSLTGHSDSQPIIVRNNNGFWDIGYDQPTNKLFFGVFNGSWNKVFTPVITANEWVHVVAVFQPNSQLKIYLNGILAQTLNISFTNPSNFGTALFFGGENGVPTKTLNGKIDDFIQYNYALSAAEIQQLYTLGNATYSWSPGGATTPSITVSPTTTTTYTCTATANGQSTTASSVVTVIPAPTITTTNSTLCAGQSTTLTASTTVTSNACPTLSGSLTSGLVGFWPFCGNANDASGNGNNGTVNGATLTTDRFGNTNSAYSFDGVNDFIEMGIPNLPIVNNSRSISVWTRLNSYTTNSGATVFHYGNVSYNNRFCLLYWPNHPAVIGEGNDA